MILKAASWVNTMNWYMHILISKHEFTTFINASTVAELTVLKLS